MVIVPFISVLRTLRCFDDALRCRNKTYNSVDGTREKMFSHSIARIVVAWGTVRFFINIRMEQYSVFTLSFQNSYQQSVKQARDAFFALMPQRDIIMQTGHVCVCVCVIARNSSDPHPHH